MEREPLSKVEIWFCAPGSDSADLIYDAATGWDMDEDWFTVHLPNDGINCVRSSGIMRYRVTAHE